MKKLATILLVLLVLAMAMPVAAKAPVGAQGAYIVVMTDEPAIAYEGGIPGLKATAPKAGQKINPNLRSVTNYVGYLAEKHDQALAKVGGGQKLYDYAYSINAFAARMTAEQAELLASVEGVKSVEPDVLQTMDTSSTPSFLGLDAPGGLWEQLGGMGKAGEGIIIGIVDSGIWPENPSFTDRTGVSPKGKDRKLGYQQIPGWHGKCVPGEAFNASMCNQKLIGAQYFNAAWGGNAAIEAERPWEFTSARDYNGHGTHTSSTAGGNNGVAATGAASVFGAISGMAPRARIAMYKALWSTEDGSTASGFTSDLVAAIDQAVADGVDVINYSISGTQTNFLDAAQLAFLYAARAGVFVSASAGNSGPTTATVAHPGPWLTTVAAGTHNRSGEGSVTLGDGMTYYGASLATAVGPAPLINAADAGVDGAVLEQLALCYSSLDGGNWLDPAKVAGKIVVCDRGVTARVNKSYAVREAGGVGMILVNTAASSLNADFHFVPTVHLSHLDGPAVKAYAATPGATATINQATVVYDAAAPFTASFSSRGPLRAGNGDLLKPDVIAPGQDILAAVAPPGNAGRDFNLYSGTSMSAPHVAGLAALLKQAHPDWTPMMIKSALMTSAYDVLDGPNTHPMVIFRQGAGHVRPNSAVDPGLVFNAGWNDWLAFLCRTSTGVSAATCDALAGMGYSLDPSDLNVASIAIGDMAGMQTVTRRVTNVGSTEATYTASTAGMAGFIVTIEPASLTLAPGQTKSFAVTFTRTTAPLNAYTGGQLTWSDGAHNVRIPMVVKPVALAAPVEITGSGESGSASFDVTFGYAGAYSAAAHGLVPATVTTGNVLQDPDQTFDPADEGHGATVHEFTLAGAAYFRIAMPPDATEADADLDLYVFNPSGDQVASSGNGGTDELVNIAFPADGTWKVYVHGWAAPGGDSDYVMYTWAISATPGGNMTVDAPAAATTGATGTINVNWTGATAGQWHLGAVSHTGPSGLLGLTVVNVDNR